jgi:coenzyme F420-reducing hydrogenase alpha subunit
VRSVEVVHAVEDALRILDAYRAPDRSYVDVPPRAGEGHGATEAPRGTLLHRYRLAADGNVLEATIVAPTSQNQNAIEADLAELVAAHLHLDDAELTRLCEQAIRNYDPCISCAAHFLDLTVDRR